MAETLEEEFKKLGLAPNLPSTAWRESVPLYYGNKQIGYATSGCWSPLLKRYIALAHIKCEYARENFEIKFETKIEHIRKLIPAIITKIPFYNPKRKRSCPT